MVSEPGLELVNLPAGDSILADAPTTDRYPLEMYDRIFAAHYLPQDLERVLYLDPDLVVNGPLDDLWEPGSGGQLVWGSQPRGQGPGVDERGAAAVGDAGALH